MKKVIISYKKVVVENVKNQHVLNGLSGNDYRVATFSKSYLPVTGIIMQSLKSIGQLKHV